MQASRRTMQLRTGSGTFCLVCFAHAGASSHAFKSWLRFLPGDFDVYTVANPGRRPDPLLVDGWEPLVESIALELAELKLAPSVFLGQSMGALVAFETIRALRRFGTVEVRKLIVCGFPGPSALSPAGLSRFSDEEFVARLLSSGSIPQQLVDNKKLLNLLLPALRTDIAIVDSYAFKPEDRPLSCPVIVLAGEADHSVSKEDLDAWSAMTCGGCSVQRIAGGHVLLETSPAGLARAVMEEVCLP